MSRMPFKILHVPKLKLDPGLCHEGLQFVPDDLRPIGMVALRAMATANNETRVAGAQIHHLLIGIGALRNDPAIDRKLFTEDEASCERLVRKVDPATGQAVAARLHPRLQSRSLAVDTVELRIYDKMPASHVLSLHAAVEPNNVYKELFTTVITSPGSRYHGLTLLRGMVQGGETLHEHYPSFEGLSPWSEAILSPTTSGS